MLGDERSLSTQIPPSERHPDPESSSGQASEPASAIQDPEKESAARGPAGVVPRFGQYVDDPVNNNHSTTTSQQQVQIATRDQRLSPSRVVCID